MNKFRFLTSGESHGMCLNAIIEGLPSNLFIDTEFVNSELARRQQGYGRGGRMQIETDKAMIKSGVRFGKTTGAPVCLEIENKDWKNWQIPMSVEPQDLSDPDILEAVNAKKITRVRRNQNRCFVFDFPIFNVLVSDFCGDFHRTASRIGERLVSRTRSMNLSADLNRLSGRFSRFGFS